MVCYGGPPIFSLYVREMARQPRSPRAFQVKGGRWFRPPRPRPIAKSRSPPLEEDHKEDTQDVLGYETCEESVKGDVTAGLVASVQPVIKFLAGMDMGAAKIVAALCCRLEKREDLVGRLRSGVKKARGERDVAQAKVTAQEDAQGQSARHWWQAKKLKGQVDFAMQANSRLRQQLCENYRHYVPYRHPP